MHKAYDMRKLGMRIPSAERCNLKVRKSLILIEMQPGELRAVYPRSIAGACPSSIAGTALQEKNLPADKCPVISLTEI